MAQGAHTWVAVANSSCEAVPAKRFWTHFAEKHCVVARVAAASGSSQTPPLNSARLSCSWRRAAAEGVAVAV